MATNTGKTEFLFVAFVLIMKVTCFVEDQKEGEQSILTLDTKEDGEISCNPKAFRKTFPAADLLGHCVNMLRPGSPMGDKCFQVDLTMSVDCLWWNPKGFNVQRERVGVSKVQHQFASSLLEISHEAQFSLSATIGASYGPFSASASTAYSERKKTASSHSEKMEYMMAFMQQIDHQAEMSLAFPPDVDEHLIQIVQELEATKERIRQLVNNSRPIVNNNSARQNQTAPAVSQEEVQRMLEEEEEKLFRVISRAGTHILLKSAFGSETKEVSFTFVTASSKVLFVLVFFCQRRMRANKPKQ